MIKAQSLLQEFYTGEKLILKQGDVSLEEFFHSVCSSNLQLLWSEISLPSLEGWPRIYFQSNKEYQNQLCPSTAYAVQDRVSTTDRKQSVLGTVKYLLYWLFLSLAIKFWPLLETSFNLYGWSSLCQVVILGSSLQILYSV